MAAPVPRLFSPTNVFIPQATRDIVGWIRKPGQFKLLDYVQMVGSSSRDDAGKPICAYAILDPDAPVRTGPVNALSNPDPTFQGHYQPSVDSAWRWDPGQDAPVGNIISNFRWQTVEMLRRAFPYDYDEQTDQSADLPVGQIYRQIAASLAMTVKTHRVISMLENANTWPTANKATVAALIGGTITSWQGASAEEMVPAGTPNEKFAIIRKSVQLAAVKIVLLTNGAVRPEDLRVIISPPLAMMLGSTGEIYAYVKSSPFSQARQEGRNELNEQYGMPKYYAGVEWVIEDAPIVYGEYKADGSSAAISATGRQFIKNDTTAIMVSRKGGLNGVYGAPSFSTIQVYFYKYEMAVEEMHDTWNKKHKGRVVDQYAEVPAALRAGFLIQNVWPTAVPMLAESGPGDHTLEGPGREGLPGPETPEAKEQREEAEAKRQEAEARARQQQHEEQGRRGRR